MVGYSRRQILFVLLVVGAAGAGIVVDQWRRARPEVVERLEQVDRAQNASVTGAVTSEGGVAADRRPWHRRAAHGAADGARAAARRKTREAAGPVDVNRASVPELERLPGIGPALAARIVQARPFAALDDLARVRGLRPATLERLRPLLTTP
jgi:DNA uptake protein ComE-like DNA-binding protein